METQALEDDDAIQEDLNNLAREVKTEDDFRNFVSELLEDLQDDPGSWNNHYLEIFLEAMVSCVPDVQDYYENHGMTIPQEPTWSHFAHILLAAKTHGSYTFDQWVSSDQK
jgi:hypothetical protein